MFFKGYHVQATPLDVAIKTRPVSTPALVSGLRAGGARALMFFGSITDPAQIQSYGTDTYSTLYGDTTFCRTGYPLKSQNVLLLECSDQSLAPNAPPIIGASQAEFITMFNQFSVALAGRVDVVMNVNPYSARPLADAWISNLNGHPFSGKLLRYKKYVLSQYVFDMDLANPFALPPSYLSDLASTPPIISGELTKYAYLFDRWQFTAPDPLNGFGAGLWNSAEDYIISNMLADTAGNTRFSMQRSTGLSLSFVESFFGL